MIFKTYNNLLKIMKKYNIIILKMYYVIGGVYENSKMKLYIKKLHSLSETLLTNRLHSASFFAFSA